MFKRLHDFMFGSPLLQLTTLPGLMAIGFVVLEIYAVFEIQELSTLVIKRRDSFKICQFASAIGWQRHCQRLTRNLHIFR